MWWFEVSTNPVNIEQQLLYLELHKQITLDENSEYSFSHNSELCIVLPEQRHNTSLPQSVNEITVFTQIQHCTQFMNCRGQKLMLLTSRQVNTILEKPPTQPKSPKPISSKFLKAFKNNLL